MLCISPLNCFLIYPCIHLLSGLCLGWEWKFPLAEHSLSLSLCSGKPASPVSFSSDQNIACKYILTAHKACKHCCAFGEWCSDIMGSCWLEDNSMCILLGSLCFECCLKESNVEMSALSTNKGWEHLFIPYICRSDARKAVPSSTATETDHPGKL